MKTPNLKTNILFLMCLFAVQLLSAFPVQQYTAPISVLESGNTADTFFSATENGFVTLWNTNGGGDSYQVSDIVIRLLAVHPEKNEIALYETDNFGIHRVSVWNWETKTRKYAKRITDTVVSLAYSAKGTYLMLGTTSVNGLLFLDAQTGEQKMLLSEPTGIVTLAVTGATETSLIAYSRSGMITYSDLVTGKTKAQFPTEANLVQPVLHANNMSLTGVKAGNIYTINATNGKLKATFAVPKGFNLTKPADTNIYYVDFENGLYVIKNDLVDIQYCVLPADPIRTFLRGEDASSNEIRIYMGADSGSLYKVTVDPYGVPKQPIVLTEKNQMPIYDVTSDGFLFYFLTPKGIYSSVYENSELQLLSAFCDATNIISSNNNLYAWTVNQVKPVYQNGNAVYIPKTPITSLSAAGDILVIIENETTVNVFNTGTKKIDFTYTGTGLQSAFLKDNFLYLAKTAFSATDPSVVRINILNSETVPLSVIGDIVYNIKPYGNKNAFIGLKVILTQNAKSTEVFEYNTDMNIYTKLMEIPDEDTNAFLFPTVTYIFTNLGRGNVMAIDYIQNKLYRLARSSALPKKMIGSNMSFITLNMDGSISWYDAFTNNLLGNWYIDKNGKWIF